MARLAVSRDNLRQFYDARYSARHPDQRGGLAAQRVKDVLAAIPIRVRTLLDYGCGQGGWLPLLSRVFPGARITGVDISPVAISRAQEQYPEQQFYLMEGETAPLAAESFDLVFSYHVLEHVYDVKRTVADLARLVRTGGYLCIIFPCGNAGSFEEKVTNLIKNGKEKSITQETRFFYEDAGHIRRMTSDEIINLGKNDGLVVFQEFYAHQFWGAVNWLSKSDANLVREFFDPHRAVDPWAKIKLLGLRIFFLNLLTPMMNLYSLDLCQRIRETNDNNFKKLFFLGLLPFKMISLSLGGMLDKLAAFEWRHHKYEDNGSEQYLLLQKI
jgi:SAM-dependent methyltransferase